MSSATNTYEEECIDGIMVRGNPDEVTICQPDGEPIRIPVDYAREFASVVEEATTHALLEREMDAWMNQS